MMTNRGPRIGPGGSRPIQRGGVFVRFRVFLLVVLSVCPGLVFTQRASAGGGPENVLLVVNRNSSRSLTIANHYIRLRSIPAGNVLTLPLAPEPHTLPVDRFRKEILLPILTAVGKRRLQKQIDYIVYSSDFPWGIDLKTDVQKFKAALKKAGAENPRIQPKWPQQFTPVGSINGMTYLWQPVLSRNIAYFHALINEYMRLTPADQDNMKKRMQLPTRVTDSATLGFRSTHQFGPLGELVPSGGVRYFLSTMLAVTAGRGNTVDEVLAYLRRSAAADGTHPRGTIYFVRNGTARSTPRHDVFPAAVEELQKLGVAAAILEGKLPMQKRDVQGAMVGLADFTWPSSGSTILPGAICEHFTSFGGIMNQKMLPGKYQTPLSEFLRHGAAGASGTPTEPYALPVKFPSAMIHVHYARGCTLAEAFYQSVSSPYQLLIVGDPLCRPWANIPQVQVAGVEPGSTVQGTLNLKPSATFPHGSTVDHFELFVDGWRRTECRPGETLDCDTSRLADGYHELRVVAVQSGRIASQGRTILGITTANHGRRIAVTVAPQSTVRPGQPLWVAANSPGSTEIAVLHNSRLLGKILGEKGFLKIDPATLGYGPVRLRAVGLGGQQPLTYVWAKPIELTVERN